MQTFYKKDLMIEYVDTTKNIKTIIKDLAIKVDIDCSGLPSLNSANVCIYNLSQQELNKFSYIQTRPLNNSKYTIYIYSIVEEQKQLVFVGDVVNAYPVYTQIPDVFLQIEAITDYNLTNNFQTPSSFKGVVKVQDIVKNMAGKMKKTFTNNGVDETTENLYLEGSTINQIKQLSNDYNYDTIIDRDNLIISKKGKPVEENMTIIDCNSGLVQGYIQNDQNGILLKTYYNSNFQLNGKLRVKNSINSICNGDWIITKVSHSLSSRINGDWSSIIKASYIV